MILREVYHVYFVHLFKKNIGMAGKKNIDKYGLLVCGEYESLIFDIFAIISYLLFWIRFLS